MLNHCLVSNQNRIPSFDGMRAVAIIFVLLGHTFQSSIEQYLNLGNLGVRIFFIISAFLIIGILQKDINYNRFSIKQFYFKRILRTFPSFYFYIISIFLFLFLINLFDWNQVWRAPLYVENYHARSNWTNVQWFIGHSWSLAVEEQFYILSSCIFLLLNKKIIKENNLITLLTIVIIASPILRILYMFSDAIPIFLRESNNRSFETVCDALAVGGVLTLRRDQLFNNKYYNYIMQKPSLLIFIIFSTSILTGSLTREIFGYLPKIIYNAIGITIINISVAMCLDYFIRNPRSSLFGKIINSKAMISIGLYSYSIYLWQQPWLYTWKLSIFTKYIGLISCSLCSYFLIERPFLVWRDSILKKQRANKVEPNQHKILT